MGWGGSIFPGTGACRQSGSQCCSCGLHNMRFDIAGRHRGVACRMTESPTEDRHIRLLQQGRWTSNCMSAHLL